MVKAGSSKEIVDRVRARLLALEQAPTPDTPLGDIEWLRLRCEDTLGRYGDDEYWYSLSLRQLKKDVTAFHDGYPGLLDPGLVAALEAVPVRAY